MPLGLALRRQKQADPCEFEDTLVYKASPRSTKDYTWRPCLLKKKKKKEEGYWGKIRNNL